MERIVSTPRDDWRTKIEYTGLIYSTSQKEDGSFTDYWNENAYYTLTDSEVTYLERTTEKLHLMSLEAAKFLATGEMGTISIGKEALELAAWSLEKNQPSLYGRFDFAFDGTSHAKMLEYNGDTPTGLIESAITQHQWASDKFPHKDQWNNLHDALLNRWKELKKAGQVASGPLYFAHSMQESSGEDWMNTAYLRDTATQAGFETVGINIEDIGWNTIDNQFRGNWDEHIPALFKLYPWEDIVYDEFGKHVMAYPESTQWIEPAWKMLISTKALLPALWHLYPDHENLLPAYLDGPNGMKEWVKKPLHGREGDNITIHAEGVDLETPGDYGHEGFCFQKFNPLPDFNGNRAVIGSWVVGGKSVGGAIRESDGYVTDYYARFVPHIIEG